MMTPQEVANCTFAKSMVGGYNMASVDDFLDKLTEDYTALYKENAALKAKLKMTVDKMAEYRESEDAIRSTLLAAQKMSTAMISEAEQKRDSVINNATASAKARLAELQQQIADAETRLESIRFQVDKELEVERRRLRAGQEQLRAFIRDVRAVCNAELEQLERLPELPAEEEKPAVPAIQVIAPAQNRQAEEEPVPAPAAQPAAAPAAVPVPAPAPAPAPVPDEQEVAQNLAQLMSAFAAADLEDEKESGRDDPFAEEELEDSTATRILNLDDLQFGPNYTRD